MVEGYIVYELFYYASEYIKKIYDTPGEMVWDDQRHEDKRKGEILQTNKKNILDKEKVIYIFSNLYGEILYTKVDNIYLISYYSF